MSSSAFVCSKPDLAEHRRVSVSQGIVEVLGSQQARGQAVNAQAFGVQLWICERAHLSPVDIQHAGAQLLPQELRLGSGCRVLLHVLHKAVAFGMACARAVN